MAEEDSGGFKIRDRRQFNPDGTVRESSEKDDRSFEATVSVISSDPKIEAPPRAAVEPPAEAAVFVEFLSGLIVSAQASMGLIKHPELRGEELDLQSARQIIDLLGAIQQKTRGNLSKREEQFLQTAIDELRMHYVRLSSSRK